MKIMIITPLDYATFDNIEHYMARHYVEQGDEVTVFSKKMNRSTSPLSMVWQTVTCTASSSRKDGCEVISVDPLFNYYAGLRRAAEARVPTGQSSNSGRGSRSAALPALLAFLALVLSPLAVLRDLFFLPSMLAVALARTGRQDVCIGMGPWGALVAFALTKIGRARFWMYKDRDYEPGLVPDRLRQGYTRWLEAALIRRADLLVTIGYRLRDLRRAQTGREAALVPTGVDWTRFAAAREAKRAGATMVYVGKLVPWSGLDVVIRALPAIAAAVPEARLRIIGDDLPVVREGLQDLAREHGVGDRVVFCGAVPHARIAAALEADADVGLANSEPIPYRQYAFPLKVIEYMAAGIPVIATSDTESAEIVARADCGVACAYDPVAFATSAIALLGDAQRRDAFSRNGMVHGRALAWSRVLERERELMAGVLRVDGVTESGNKSGTESGTGDVARAGVAP